MATIVKSDEIKRTAMLINNMTRFFAPLYLLMRILLLTSHFPCKSKLNTRSSINKQIWSENI